MCLNSILLRVLRMAVVGTWVQEENTLRKYMCLCFIRDVYALSLIFNNDKGPLVDHILWHGMTFVCRCAFKHLFNAFLHGVIVP